MCLWGPDGGDAGTLSRIPPLAVPRRPPSPRSTRPLLVTAPLLRSHDVDLIQEAAAEVLETSGHAREVPALDGATRIDVRRPPSPRVSRQAVIGSLLIVVIGLLIVGPCSLISSVVFILLFCYP